MNTITHWYGISGLSRRFISAILAFGLLLASFGAILAPNQAFAAISYGSVSSAANETSPGDADELEITKPSGTVSGDFLIAGITINGGTEVNINTVPSGWVLIERTDNDDDLMFVTYYKVAGGSEPASYEWEFDRDDNGDSRAAGGIIRYTGVDTTSPIDEEAEDEGFDDDFVAPSVGTDFANDLVVVFYGQDDDNDHPTPSGTSERFDVENPNNGGPRVSAADFTQVAAGATGTKTIDSGNANNDWIAQTIALKQGDSTPPTLAEVTPVPTPDNDSTPSYTFSSNEAGTITYGGDCSSGTTAAVAGNNTVTFNALADGAHTNCTITVTDVALNASTPLAVSSFTVDTVAPTLAEVTPVTTPTNNNTPSYTFSANEAGAITYGGTCSSATTAAISGNNPVTFAMLADGVYGTCTITVTDDAGNVSTALNVSSFTVDTLAPTATLSLLSSNPTNSSPVQFQVSFSETVSGFDNADVTVGGVGGTVSVSGSNPYTIDVTPSSEGTLDVQVNASGANDLAGNGNSASSVVSGVYDMTAPSVSITSGPTNGSFINVNTPSFSFTATDALSNPVTTDCQVDGGGFLPCSSPNVLAALGEGVHTFDVRGTDGATNVSATASRNFTVDTIQPNVVLTAPILSPLTTNAWPITITATFDEPVTGVDASDLTTTPGVWLIFSSGSGTTYFFDIYPFGDGNTEISMNAGAGQDQALNGSSGSTSIFVTPDYTAPVITLNGSNPQIVTLNDTYVEEGATALDAIDGPVSVTPFGSVDTATLGTYLIEYQATDAAGNVGYEYRTVEVKTICADGIDNDGDSFTDSGDPGCHLDNDNTNAGSYFAAGMNESNATGPGGTNNTTPGTGTGGANPSLFSNGSNGPFVLGASTGPGEVLGASTSTPESNSNDQGAVQGASTTAYSCTDGAYITAFMRMGQANDVEEVKKLQTFLNNQVQAGLTVSGIFDLDTENAVKAFQASNPIQILEPWGITDPTGYVYKTTLRWINSTACGVTLPMPAL